MASNQLNANSKSVGCKDTWVLRKKKFQLIVLYTEILTIVPLYGISIYQNHKQKLNKKQRRAVRILLYDNAYSILLHKWKKVTMKLKWLRSWALEVFKTLRNLKPIHMNEIFQKTKFLTHRSSILKFIFAILPDTKRRA